MKIPMYQVDAFTDRLFAGNPAAVCLLEHWLDDACLQSIAAENNLAETAYLVEEGSAYRLRWFTPVTEVDLCGHATLASAHVLFAHRAHPGSTLHFNTRSGPLYASRDADGIQLDFPASLPMPCDAPAQLAAGLGRCPSAVLQAEDYIAVFEDAAAVQALQPDFRVLGELGLRGVIATAPGHDVDFVSRFFAPKFGIPEDPVTGSAHCQLAPYWHGRLGRTQLSARQLSARGGRLQCALRGDRVFLTGQAITFLEASITLP